MTRIRIAVAGTVAVLAATVLLLGGALREPAQAEGSAVQVGVPVASGRGAAQRISIADYQARADAQPQDAEAATLLGLALQERVIQTGDFSDLRRSEAALNRALRLDPAGSNVISGLASLALTRHDFKRALTLGRQAQALDPTTARHYGVVGDALLELGRYREAFDTFDRMARLKPNASSYARVSYARELSGNLDGAIEAMRLAVDASSGAAGSFAWSRSLLGNLLLATGDIRLAQATFREALAVVPGEAESLAGLAKIRERQGDLRGALALYRRAAAAIPLASYYVAIGDTLDRLGRTGEAELEWRRAEEIERSFALNGGRNLLETAEFDLNHDRNIRSALDRARRGRAARPSVEGDHVLAWALYKNGECAEARAVSLRSFRLGTVDVDGLYHHSLIETCLGNAKAAAAYRRKVQRLDPVYLANAASAKRFPAAAG